MTKLLGVLIFWTASVIGQPLAVTPLRFTVTSVKFSPDRQFIQTRPQRTTGRFRWKTQLIYLLGYAYHMQLWRITERLDASSIKLNDVYEIEATTQPDATEAEVRQMLQTLLVERFKMIAHREMKDTVNGYALTIANGGPKIKEVKEETAPDDPAPADGWVASHLSQDVVDIEAKRGTMLQLSEQLQRLLRTSVIDQSGLTSKYDFKIEFQDADDDYVGVIAAVKQLGLKLDKYKGPVEFLVIEHLDRLAEN